MGAVIAVIRERDPGEARVAATPDSVKRLAALGRHGRDRGRAPAFPPLLPRRRLRRRRRTRRPLDGRGALAVRGPALRPARPLRRGPAPSLPPSTTVVALLDPLRPPRRPRRPWPRTAPPPSRWSSCRASRGLRAMDALSSQANLAGYRAVVEGAQRLRSGLSDDDDRRGHGGGGQGVRDGRGRGRAAGHRHRAAARRGGHRHRRAAGVEGAGGEPGRQVRRGNGRGVRPRPRPPPATPRR